MLCPALCYFDCSMALRSVLGAIRSAVLVLSNSGLIVWFLHKCVSVCVCHAASHQIQVVHRVCASCAGRHQQHVGCFGGPGDLMCREWRTGSHWRWFMGVMWRWIQLARVLPPGGSDTLALCHCVTRQLDTTAIVQTLLSPKPWVRGRRPGHVVSALRNFLALHHLCLSMAPCPNLPFALCLNAWPRQRPDQKRGFFAPAPLRLQEQLCILLELLPPGPKCLPTDC